MTKKAKKKASWIVGILGVVSIAGVIIYKNIDKVKAALKLA